MIFRSFVCYAYRISFIYYVLFYILVVFYQYLFYTPLSDSIFRICITLTIKALLLWKVQQAMVFRENPKMLPSKNKYLYGFDTMKLVVFTVLRPETFDAVTSVHLCR